MESEYIKTKLQHEVFNHPLNRRSYEDIEVMDYYLMGDYYIQLELKRLDNLFNSEKVWSVISNEYAYKLDTILFKTYSFDMND